MVIRSLSIGYADRKRHADSSSNRPSARILGPDKAPVWIPRTETGYFVVTCTECLRSFSVPDQELDVSMEVRTTSCLFCGTAVRYLADLRAVGKKSRKRAGWARFYLPHIARPPACDCLHGRADSQSVSACYREKVSHAATLPD